MDTNITDEELADLDANFPLQAKVVRKQRELEEKIAKAAPAPAPSAEFVPVTYSPEVQAVIDEVPDLLAWQMDPNGQANFDRAVEYDKALMVDPDWKSRPPVERFAEAARRTKAAATPAPAPAATPAAPAAPRLDPAAALAAAPQEGPKGISDFRGGAPGTEPSLDYSKMSDEAIMASLPAG